MTWHSAATSSQGLRHLWLVSHRYAKDCRIYFWSWYYQVAGGMYPERTLRLAVSFGYIMCLLNILVQMSQWVTRRGDGCWDQTIWNSTHPSAQGWAAMSPLQSLILCLSELGNLLQDVVAPSPLHPIVFLFLIFFFLKRGNKRMASTQVSSWHSGREESGYNLRMECLDEKLSVL